MRLTLPVRNIVAALEADGPLTIAELAERLQYSQERVIGFIQDARVNGVSVVCRPDPGGSTFRVPSRNGQRDGTIDDTLAPEGQSA